MKAARISCESDRKLGSRLPEGPLGTNVPASASNKQDM
jgi:hypothetical protein